MAGKRFRAWRFLFPDIDASPEFAGITLTPRGSIDMIEENDSVRQSIFMLLSIMPGERVMRPDYGCLIHRLVFSPNDDTTAGLAIHYVRRALERWEPRIDILRLDAGQNPDLPEQLDVTLEYRVRVTQRIEAIIFSMNLAGEQVSLAGSSADAATVPQPR